VRALPIADEPAPFWDGADADEQINRWQQDLGIDSAVHGGFSAPGGLNGSSGRWLDEHVLTPLGVGRNEVWITDCLDTYRMSNGVEARLGDTYDAGRPHYRWPARDIEPHPSESAIVSEALRSHRDRLVLELDRCRPELVVTLGNAACRVLRSLAGAGPRRLDRNGYGERQKVTIAGRATEWFPLAHPAAPKAFQEAHRVWKGQQ
jgi:hypothetical protein